MKYKSALRQHAGVTQHTKRPHSNMKRTDREISRHTKQEIGKPRHTCKPFACQTLAFFPTLCLTILILTILTFNAFGQIQTPKTPTIQNFQQIKQPWTPNPNNNIIPDYNPPLNTIQTPNNQYQKDQQELNNRQRQLDEILNEISKPEENSLNVSYDLPPCSSISGASAYQTAFSELSKMASGERSFNIKQANFVVENAYYENKGKYDNFDKVIKQIAQFLNWKMDELNYNKNSNLAKNLILYQFFADTLEIKSKNLKHYPFKYDFEDYMGQKDWSKMFVEKVLASNSGQCHSLPLLYLILADEIGAKAQLAYSPSHSYIKFQDDNGKWHNVELTNGMLTTDAFVLQSGYIKAEALQNKIYMQPLTDKQVLSHCMFDLAKGYALKYCYDSFVELVIDKALELDPNNINANMVKSDYLTLRFEYIEKQLGINSQNYKQILSQYPKAREIFIARNKQYGKIDNLGFENIPPDSYEKWLNSLNEAKQKQESQQLLFDLNKSIEFKNIKN